MTPKLELRQLTKRFAGRQAVRNLSLSVAQGEFLSLLGPSGCGKSTTLGMVAGFVEPDAGDILVDGRRINELSPQWRRIGLVFQDYAVFTGLTVRGNLAFGLEVKGMARRERRRAVDALADRFGLADLLDRSCRGLNMSEMQRIALARTLATEPELILLDEPMSNLDADIRGRLRGELRQIQKATGQTVLYVTHDQTEALSMSDRIAVMRDGELLQIATPEDIYHRPANRFVAEFIGEPPLNIIPCELRAEGSRVAVALPGDAVLHAEVADIAPGRHWLGVRPHDIKLAPQGTGTISATLRYIENLGARHVLHAEYAGELIRIETTAAERTIGAPLDLRFATGRALLIDRLSERVVPSRWLEAGTR